MNIHPQLLPAIIGAAVGLPAIIAASLWLVRRWERLSKPMRWSLFAAIALVETAYWLNVYAWLIEPRLFVVQRVAIESPHWRGPPITIAALADTHVGGPHVDVRRVERVVARINALRPDLVVLLGDYVAGHRRIERRSNAERQEIASGIAVFAALDARYGVVAVLGNHDSWYDRPSIFAALEEAGAATLWNRHVVIARSSNRFVVAGLADKDTGRPDYARAVDGAPADAPLIVITHNPDVFVDLPRRPALTIAAHTHCGQVSLPPFGRLIVPSAYGQRFACRLIVEDGRQMYVTGGLGTSIIPVRFLNPPEIALITLSPERAREGQRAR